MKKVLKVIIAAVMVIAMTASCSSGSSTTKANDANGATTTVAGQVATPSEKVTIGVSWMDLTTQYQAILKSHIDLYVSENYADKIEIVHMDGGSDSANQVSQVESLIGSGVNSILMVPFDRNGLVPAVEAAKAANIPMIELCQETSSPDRTSFVGSNHKTSGVMLMQALADKSGGKGNVVMFIGPSGQDSAIARTEGGQEVLAKYPEMKVVAEKIANWDRATAMTDMENLIQAGIPIDMIFAESDSMALGALGAIKGTELEGKVIIGGIDAIADAVDAIKSGEMYCSAFQNAKQQAITGIDVAYKAAMGEQVDALYDIPFELVTKENADDPKYATVDFQK